jgi:hypothetical protein
LEGCDQGRLRHDGTAEGIYQVSTRFHQPQFALAYQTPGAVTQFEIHAENVGLTKQFLFLDIFGPVLGSFLRRQVLAPSDETHIKSMTVSRHHLSDFAQAK